MATKTITEILHFATLRGCQPFSKHLVNADEATLDVMVSWGWLKRITKPHNRYSWQITKLGKDAYAGIERVAYEKAVAGK